jgi:hypothetical protein
MKKTIILSVLGLITMAGSKTAMAGNEQRVGQAGASELLINPWARTTGWYGLNSASIKGVESLNSNVGGLSFTRKTEAVFARTSYLQGTGININAFGLSQKVGDASVLGLAITSFDFGEIIKTNEDNPDGGIGTFEPQLLNVALAYSRTFSNSIHAGFVVRSISEALPNVKATGISIDAGVQYVTGSREQIHFGVALRNVGTPMKFSGDALISKTGNQFGNTQSLETPTQSFELPSLLNIGAAYDFQFGANNRLTAAYNFTSNSFTLDQNGIGLEYSFKEFFMIRGGYNHEKGIWSSTERQTAFTGITGGATLEIPFGENKSTVAIDYSFIGSYVYGGNHSFGARLNF